MNTQDLQSYRTHVDAMEKAGVDAEYIQGWQGGFLINPLREEQRENDTYTAGYEDGTARNMDNFKKFAK